MDQITKALRALVSQTGFSLDFESSEELRRSNTSLAKVLADRGMDLARLLAKYPVDELTGLGNKSDLLRNGWCSLAEAAREGLYVTIVFADVDDLKPLNTAYSETEVDKMIRVGGWAIKKSLRPYDQAWRFGGDEFVLVLKSKGLPNVGGLIRRIEQKWERKLVEKHLPAVTIRLSYGFCVIRPNEHLSREEATELFRASLSDANRKMRQMKAQKKAGVKIPA